MPPSAKSLGIDRFSLAERILLVEEIWDRIADEAETLEVPQSHKDELDPRLGAYDAGQHSGSSWRDVKSRLEKL